MRLMFHDDIMHVASMMRDLDEARPIHCFGEHSCNDLAMGQDKAVVMEHQSTQRFYR
jgi:hypothetical protein